MNTSKLPKKTSLAASTKASFTAYACLVYLALPLFAFLLGWVLLPLGLVLAAGLGWVLFKIYQNYIVRPIFLGKLSHFSARRLILCAFLALAWLFSGGFGEFIFTNYDWQMRGAILHDLTLTGWPTSYGVAEDGKTLLLRLPLGYYLIPSLIGKIGGLSVAYFAAFLYASFGAFLFLALATETTKKLRNTIIILVVVVLFSGMKIIGLMMLYATNVLHYGSSFPFKWPTYMHMWSGFAHYSATTTELYWSPNHALPGMLLAALWWRYRDNARLLQLVMLATPLAILWSPLATIGIVPFLIYSLFQYRHKLFVRLPPLLLVVPIIVILPVLAYLTSNAENVPGYWVIFKFIWAPMGILTRYLPFVLLEFGILIYFLYKAQPQRILIVIMVVLAALPMYWLGFYSDFAQQAAIASLTVLSLITASWLATNTGKKVNNFRYDIAVIIILVIGSITPIQEIGIDYIMPRWNYEPHCTLLEAWRQSKINPNLSLQIAALTEPLKFLSLMNNVDPSLTPEKSCWPNLKPFKP